MIITKDNIFLTPNILSVQFYIPSPPHFLAYFMMLRNSPLKISLLSLGLAHFLPEVCQHCCNLRCIRTARWDIKAARFNSMCWKFQWSLSRKLTILNIGIAKEALTSVKCSLGPKVIIWKLKFFVFQMPSLSLNCGLERILSLTETIVSCIHFSSQSWVLSEWVSL